MSENYKIHIKIIHIWVWAPLGPLGPLALKYIYFSWAPLGPLGPLARKYLFFGSLWARWDPWPFSSSHLCLVGPIYV